MLLWELHDVHIVALCDPLLLGKEKIIEILKELDPDTPWPPEDLEFTTLWCRSVRFDAANWRVQLRDFPQPLMDSRQIHFWGKLAAGEVVATKRCIMIITIIFTVKIIKSNYPKDGILKNFS